MLSIVTSTRTPFCEGGFYGMRTKRFGAMLLWPGSHRLDASNGPVDGPIPAAMAGLGIAVARCLLHGGGANASQDYRRGVIVSYCLGWLRTFESQYLIYPPDTARGFDPSLTALAS